MKPFLLLIAVLTCTLSRAQTDPNTIKEIEAACNAYLDGGTKGDSLLFSRAFYPGGQMNYMRNDTLFTVSLKDFMARARNNGVKTNRETKIESIQVFGDAAVAKLTIEYPGFYFHDIMGLLKTREGWKIVSKIFYREEKN